MQHRDESDYWDYKQQLDLDNPISAAELARDVLGFHNAKGGALIVGVDNDYTALGVCKSQVRDTNGLRGKLRKYIGPDVNLFQDTIPLPNDRLLWIIFVPMRHGVPVAVQANGPDYKGAPYIRKNQYFVRVGDQVKLCLEPADFERLFSGVSMTHLQSYFYDVDEPYFRLLAPHCDLFVGRKKVLVQVLEALNTRHPVVALDGVGGVGKSAIAIELLRQLYDSKRYMFIVSQSAKSRVWHNHIGSRRAGFSGLTEFLQELCKVLDITVSDDPDSLKSAAIETMSDLKGVLLVDNLEDIRDPAVFQFLSLEVPDPVKVLVTSRVAKGLGALTISIPQMSEEEAVELLMHELERLGSKGSITESEHLHEIVNATGRLPLALKWAAALTNQLGSLKEASRRLRTLDVAKREFLSFCFATMYDELSPLARQVASLCPYLQNEWNVPAVSIALDQSEDDVARAVQELEERGILLAASERDYGSRQLLPLTMDFLSTKWHENQNLKKAVSSRLAEAIASPSFEGILLNWPREQRVQVLRQRGEDLRQKGELNRAIRLVRLARNWSDDPRLPFLEGRILVESGRTSQGISLMRAAIGAATDATLLEERLYLSDVLLTSGGNQEEGEALRLLEQSIPKVLHVGYPKIERYCRLALELREYTSISKVLGSTDVPVRVLWIVRALEPHFTDEMLLHISGEALVRGLRLAAKTPEATDKERILYEDTAKQFEQRIIKSAKSSYERTT